MHRLRPIHIVLKEPSHGHLRWVLSGRKRMCKLFESPRGRRLARHIVRRHHVKCADFCLDVPS